MGSSTAFSSFQPPVTPTGGISFAAPLSFTGDISFATPLIEPVSAPPIAGSVTPTKISSLPETWSMTEGRLPATSMSGGNVTEHVEALAVGIASGVAGLVFITMLSIFILRRRRHFAPQKKEFDTSVKPFRNTPPHVRAPNLQADDAAVAIEDGSESYSLVVNVSENITDSVPGADAQHQPNQPSPSLAKNENEDSNLLAGNVDKPRSANTKVPVVGGGTRAVLRQYSDSGIRFEPPSPVEFIDLPPAYTQS